MKLITPLLLGILFSWNSLYSQSIKKDSTINNSSIVVLEKKKLSPERVALFSTVLPGGGQFYNKQYYKPAIIYALMAGAGYLIYSYHHEYRNYKKAYIIRIDGDSNTLDDYSPLNKNVSPKDYIFNESQILTLREDSKRFRDLSIILMAVIYTANILDAYVYAHLSEFNVSDDLSLKINPINFGLRSMNTNQFYFQTGITLNF